MSPGKPMDSSSNSSKPRTTPISHSTSSSASIGEISKPDNQFRDIMRRGHSDGDVLSNTSRLRGGLAGDEAPREGETWMDFLRHSSSAGHSIEEQARFATRRAAIMAADRKRRFTGQQEEHSRRRSASSLAFGQTSSDRIRHSMSQTATTHPLAYTPKAPENRSGHRTTDRPLPPRPSAERSPTPRSRDITLPRWQPDAEVPDCPICGAHFSFWYRKHHCRKCGRVVCANCSPHRITIPRQFIVHSPQEAGHYITHELATSSAIIDLTDDNEGDTTRTQNTASRQSHEYQIDPALGGGQEVRLCNPCVPDPNPLPHLAFAPSDRFTFRSFPSPENSARTARHGHYQPLLGPTSQPTHNTSNRTVLNRRPNIISGPRSPIEAISDSAFTASSASTAEQDQLSRPLSRPSDVSAHRPPNYSSLYGSAPDPNLHERYMGSLLHEHQPGTYGHQHYASTSNISTSSRHRLTLDANTSLPSRAVPQPILREEDECPICHCALPPKGPNGSEVAREAHVSSCIESHFSNSSPQVSRPPPATATAAAVAASIATSSQANGGAAATSENSGENSTAIFMPRRRTTGMVVYQATEKDCIGEDGERAQECVICFEEFAEGDEMGRLECLCKFHKACIRQWWDTKGPGACPVHQGGL